MAASASAPPYTMNRRAYLDRQASGDLEEYLSHVALVLEDGHGYAVLDQAQPAQVQVVEGRRHPALLLSPLRCTVVRCGSVRARAVCAACLTLSHSPLHTRAAALFVRGRRKQLGCAMSLCSAASRSMRAILSPGRAREKETDERRRGGGVRATRLRTLYARYYCSVRRRGEREKRGKEKEGDASDICGVQRCQVGSSLTSGGIRENSAMRGEVYCA